VCVQPHYGLEEDARRLGRDVLEGGFPGYSFESTPNLNDLGADVTLDAATIKAQMDMYQNGLQRYFALLGVQVKSLAPQYVPPSAHLEEQYKAISIAIVFQCGFYWAASAASWRRARMPRRE